MMLNWERDVMRRQSWLFRFSCVTFWFIRNFRATEAILGNALLRNRPEERIQKQPVLFMVELSTKVADSLGHRDAALYVAGQQLITSTAAFTGRL